MNTITDSVVRYDVDADKIAIITFDDPSSAANTMSARFKQDFADVLGNLAADIEAGSVIGAVVASAKDSFFAGGNVKALLEVGPPTPSGSTTTRSRSRRPCARWRPSVFRWSRRH